jgi:hypothetical protein
MAVGPREVRFTPNNGHGGPPNRGFVSS